MINIVLHDEKLLLDSLKEGDQQAFTDLYNYYSHPVYDIALTFLKSSSLSEEIVQDVFMKIWVKRSEMGMVKDFRAYIFVMARNLIFDRIKRQAHETSAKIYLDSQQFFVDDTEHLVRHHQCQQTLHEAINLLPPQQKQVYQLARVQGLSQDTIAEKMQISRLTVKTHMAKALKSIRTYIRIHLNCLSILMVPVSIFHLF